MRGVLLTAAAVCLGSTLCGSAAAETAVPVLGAGSYAQELVNRTRDNYPNVEAMTLFATLPGPSGTIAVASTVLAAGAKPSGLAATALKSGAAERTLDAAHRLDIALPLLDMQRHRAGVVALTLSPKSGKHGPALAREARDIREMLARRISYAGNLAQDAHPDANVPLNSYAQHLVDVSLERHPDVLIIAIHAKTPKNSDPEILASNIGRIGKKADDDDMRVVRDGKTNLEVNKDLVRFEVELPLNDVSGVRLGALGVVFPLTPGLDQNAKHQEAIQIRDEISSRILTPGNLVEPYPYDHQFSDRTMAQHLVDAMLVRHPDIQVLALHVTAASTGKNIILASNIGRIGKVGDEDDMGVVSTGKPAKALNADGDRYEVELALNDRAGQRIGAVSIVYGYKPGDDKVVLDKKAEAVAKQLSHEIPDSGALFASRH